MTKTLSYLLSVGSVLLFVALCFFYVLLWINSPILMGAVHLICLLFVYMFAVNAVQINEDEEI